MALGSPPIDVGGQSKQRNVQERLLHCELEKLDPFSFEHNFGKHSPIKIILSLLQIQINCDQVYPKIYHRIPNLLVHYLVK